ncbi:hypothetical protein Ahy_B08g089402 isoform D [Arachis hypogaea]|uniref:TPX2 C-terminal domain-containing protein n=1 Tax=Arachis hypogaea TaxID=3818 RepID=A0A444XXT7_ARAHY|nr:hypothetical protein Ahy_B08g089402 isoform D [Arachis hypogaea]
MPLSIFTSLFAVTLLNPSKSHLVCMTLEGLIVISLMVDRSVAEITEMASPNGNVENFDELDGAATDNSSVVEIREVANGSSNGNNVDNSNDKDVTTVEDQSRQLRAQKGPMKEKCTKPTGSKGVHTNSVKRFQDGKDEHASSAVSNGTSASEPHPRQPAKIRSYDDKETLLSKHPGKSDPVSSEVPLDKAKPRSLKKGPAENVQGGTECSSPTAEDAKHRRVGALPNYGFSFKCDERAERRKQFYSKLEEKIHAKEVEESNLQAKTKETQEAEIKMLRKSLAFKATPMPSFYQEPTPPRVELKKIPTTRAKSPKLGRRKSATHPESEGDAISSAQIGRLSLDEKASQSTLTKGISPVNQKKPQRKSLPPRLGSEKSSPSNSSTARTPSKTPNYTKTPLSSIATKVTTLSNSTVKDKVKVAEANEENNILSHETSKVPPLNSAPSPMDKPSEAELCTNGNVLREEKQEQEQTFVQQEPIATKN